MIKKADIILGFFLILLCLGSFLLVGTAGGGGQTVTVTVDGKLYGTYDLDQDQSIEIEQSGQSPQPGADSAGHAGNTDHADSAGHAGNVIEIRNGTVRMASATCANQVCVEQGSISRTNQTIVCLPNRVLITLSGADRNGDMDAFSH